MQLWGLPKIAARQFSDVGDSVTEKVIESALFCALAFAPVYAKAD
jgi:hypothetical protein